MDFTVEKNEQYVQIKPKTKQLTGENVKNFEKQIVQLYKEGQVNYIADLEEVTLLDENATKLFQKVNKLCERESGILILVSTNDDVLDIIEPLKEEGIVVLATLHEAVEAVFMNDLENEFKDEADEEDMFGFGEDTEV